MTAIQPGLRVCVTGLGVSGVAAARALLDRGARVLAVDARDDELIREVAADLRNRGAEVRLGDAETPVDADLIVTSPGWRPSQPLLVVAQAQGIEVIGEPELAWRLEPVVFPSPDRPPWLGVTGTNGKTTTVGMLASMLSAAGYRTVAAGNVGTPLVDVVRADPLYDVIAVEMSSFQLHWSSSICFQASTVLNIAPDHLDWHGSMEAYAADKAKIWANGVGCALYNMDDEWSRRLGEKLPDSHNFSVTSEDAEFAIRDGHLHDPWPDGGVLASVADVELTGQHNLANALAAAGLARLLSFHSRFEIAPEAVRAGLSAYRPGPHRNQVVATLDDVVYVDDSKATNAHAAAASLSAYHRVVWIAGGLLKGASVDELVVEQRDRLHGVVLIGVDRARIRDALARHAPDVPVVEVEATDTGAMTAIVGAARRLADPGDTVLLAPAAASMDMFRDYAERGDVFAAAVRRLAEDRV